MSPCSSEMNESSLEPRTLAKIGYCKCFGKDLKTVKVNFSAYAKDLKKWNELQGIEEKVCVVKSSERKAWIVSGVASLARIMEISKLRFMYGIDASHEVGPAAPGIDLLV